MAYKTRHMKSLVLSAVVVSGMVGSARADIQTDLADAPENPLVTPWSRPQPIYVLTDPGLPSYRGPDSVHLNPNASKVIYLNNCKPAGCQVTPGGNNSTTTPPTSQIPEQQSVVQP